MKFWKGLLIVAFTIWRAGPALGYCGSHRLVQVGRLPDIIFPPGRVSCVTIPAALLKIKLIADTSAGNCATYARSTSSHFMVATTTSANCATGFQFASDNLVQEMFNGKDDPFVGQTFSPAIYDLIIRSDGAATGGSGAIQLMVRIGEFTPPSSNYAIGQQSVFVSSTATDNAFTHTVAPANHPSPSHTVISHPLADGYPAAYLVVMPVYNYNNVFGGYNNHPIYAKYGVDVSGKWSIINTDGGAFNDGAQFNVEIEGSGTNDYSNATGASGNTFPVALNPSYTNNVGALLFPTARNSYNSHTIGAWYDGSLWYVFNEDGASFNTNSSYAVLGIGAPDTSLYAFQQSGSVTGNVMLFPPGGLNSAARIFAVANFNLPNYLASPLGVYWTGAEWSVFRQDLQAMPSNVQFNVFKHIPAVVAP